MPRLYIGEKILRGRGFLEFHRRARPVAALFQAAHNAVVLEAVARMAYYTSTLNAACNGVAQHLLDRHYFRKHGASKTYGQSGN